MNSTVRVKDIDVLRGIAIIIVFIQHLPINLIYWQHEPLFKFYNYFDGTAGVALFFVISGFLITKLYHPDFQQENKTTVINNALFFWCKRAVRLFPAAWFWLLAIIAGSLFLNQTNAFGPVKASIEGAFAALFQIANFRFMSCFNHYECGLNNVQWSLSLEQQFYFIFPFLVYFSKHRLTSLLALVLILQLFSETFAAPFGLRFSGFVLGILIGILSTTPYYTAVMPVFLNRSLLLRTVLFSLLIVALAFSMGKEVHIGTSDQQYNLAVMISGILVLLASYNQSWLLPPSRIKSLLLFIGQRSYSYYLCHMFCFALTKTLLQLYYPTREPGSITALIYIGLATLFCGVSGEFSYRVFEVNFKKRALPHLIAFKRRLPPVMPQTFTQDKGNTQIRRQSHALAETV
ncbi:acyltransferase [uncultured Legionella sp.]|uniref:acyltransferase family protein n=1 Tax=uncultured Legionella sp. TaxID=210934 RepID=UPI0026119134|nr:acyltransferase [uncultured Legionella sp.]